jgi:hypothetical protein
MFEPLPVTYPAATLTLCEGQPVQVTRPFYEREEYATHDVVFPPLSVGGPGGIAAGEYPEVADDEAVAPVEPAEAERPVMERRSLGLAGAPRPFPDEASDPRALFEGYEAPEETVEEKNRRELRELLSRFGIDYAEE